MDASEFGANEFKNIFNCNQCEDSECDDNNHEGHGNIKPEFNIENRSLNDFFEHARSKAN